MTQVLPVTRNAGTAAVPALPRAAPLAAMLCLIAPAALAEGERFYFGGFLGAGDTTTANTSFTDAGERGTLDYDLGTPVGGGLILGWQYSDTLRSEVELSLSDASVSGTTRDTVLTAPATETADGDVQITYVMANGWLDVPVGGLLNPYVGGGLGVAHVSGDVTQGGGGMVLGSDSALAAQVGAGLRFPTGFGGAIDIGYRYKTVTGAELDQSGSAFTTDGEFSSHSVNIGYIFNF